MIEEQRIKLQAYRVYAICNEPLKSGNDCKGQVEFTGRTKAAVPAMYQHVCPKCGKDHWLKDRYPAVRYEESK